MTEFDLATQIRLHRRACILRGTVVTRSKRGGALAGLTPHYATNGCPEVQYAGQTATPWPHGAEIEFDVAETECPMPQLAAMSPKQRNLVQLMFGRLGQAPTQAEYRLLREASTVLGTLAQRRDAVLVVGYPVLVSGQYGVSSGRFHLLGVWLESGEAVFVNPEAIAAGMLASEFPSGQVGRGTTDGLDASTLRQALRLAGIEGEDLEQAVRRAQANSAAR